jgi:DNA polymerase III subunit epsilon
MREIVIDTETTGLDPEDGYRFVEIGAVELINRSPAGQTFHRYVCPEHAHLPSLSHMVSTICDSEEE